MNRPATFAVALAVLTLTLLGAAPLLGGWFLDPAGARAAESGRGARAPNHAAGIDAARAVAARADLARPETAPRDTDDPDSGLRLTLTSMSPRLITATGPNTLTVTGTVANTGDRPIRNVEIRAQLSARLRTEGDVRTALSGNADDDAVVPAFTRLSAELAPGASTQVQLSVPVRGSDPGSLAVSRTGVYELLLDVNGAPGGGAQTRLVGVRSLLPVLGLPSLTGTAAAAPPRPAGTAPRPVSLLYPLSDQPHRLPTGPGEPVVLGDDQLGLELSPGGRLDGLLSALDAGAPVGSPARSAICLAVDPDLLRTVQEMVGGYQVRGPDGSTQPGRAAAAAGSWLNRLRGAANGRCVIALPFADADLVALSRAGLTDLSGYATIEGARIASEILGTPVRSDTTWPAGGLLDERSLGDYAAAGGREVVLSGDAVSDSRESGSGGSIGGTVRIATPDAVTDAVLADPLVTLAATGDRGGPSGAGGPLSTTFGDGGRPFSPLGSSGGLLAPADQGVTLSAQDAIGAVAYRALAPAGVRSGPLLIAPPHQWNTTGADARELLTAVNTMITSGRLAPAPLPTPGGSGPASDTGGTHSGGADQASLVYPLRAGAREVPTSVTAQLRADRDVTAALRSAAIPAQGVGTTPAQVFDPVSQGLLRAASAVWRGHPGQAAAATSVITDRVGLLRSLVRVVKPPTPYALGDQEAPLPFTLSNGLPVAMRVRVLLAYTPGLKINSIQPDPLAKPIPPNGRLQLRANVQLTRSGSFSVEARLTTPDGAPLGQASQLQLRSTAYGTITLWLTGTAGLLLVILAVRRIVRRLRGSVSPSAASRTPAAAGAPPGTPTTGTRPTGPPLNPVAAPPTSRRQAGTRPRDPMPRRLGALARAEDEAAIRRGPTRTGPPPAPSGSPTSPPSGAQASPQSAPTVRSVPVAQPVRTPNAPPRRIGAIPPTPGNPARPATSNAPNGYPPSPPHRPGPPFPRQTAPSTPASTPPGPPPAPQNRHRRPDLRPPSDVPSRPSPEDPGQDATLPLHPPTR